jgi:hypothetical protein
MIACGLAHLIAAAALAAARPAYALQRVDGGAAVHGYVTDQFGQPVGGAEVAAAMPGGVAAVRTDEAGSYRLDALSRESARLELRVRRLGYLPLTAAVPTADAPMLARDFEMLRLPPALDPALVERPDGELRADFGTFLRRRGGGASSLDRAAIDRLAPVTVSEVVRALPGFREPAAGCTARVFVDDVPYTPVDGVDDFDPEQLEAVEGYASGIAVPAALGTAAGACGVVVLWLRR